MPERAVNNPGGPGHRFPDLTFEFPNGTNVYVNTVTTYRSGLPIIDEVEAALDLAKWGNGIVIMIPKR